MAKTLKTIYAGGQVVRALYDRRSRWDSPTQRAHKDKKTSEAVQRMNRIYSFQKLELLLSTNFPSAGSGLVVTLTFDDRHMPKNRSQAADKFGDWREKMNKARAKQNLPKLVAIWCIEVLTSESGRWHVHAVINNTGDDYDMIRKCWTCGTDVEIEKLRVDREKNWETLARYMTKEARDVQDADCKVGQRGWSSTHNCLRPEIETIVVDDNYLLEAPQDAVVLLDERKQTTFAGFHVMKWRWNHTAPAPRARRIRRPRRLDPPRTRMRL